MIKKLTLPAVVLTSLVLSACSTMNAEQRAFYDNQQTKLKQAPASIISSPCLVRFEVTNAQVLQQQSELVGKAMSATLKTELATKGVAVTKSLQPLLCGSLKQTTLLDYQVQPKHDAKRQDITSYPLLATNNAYSMQTNQAFAKLFTAVALAKRPSRKSLTTTLDLSPQSLSALKTQLGSDKVFVLLVDGNQSSFGRNMLIGVATLAISGGEEASVPENKQTYSLYLVDLAKNQLEWAGKRRSFNGKVFKMPVSESFKMPNMLKPLYID